MRLLVQDKRVPRVHVPSLNHSRTSKRVNNTRRTLNLLRFLLGSVVLRIRTNLFLGGPNRMVQVRISDLNRFFPTRLVFRVLNGMDRGSLRNALAVFFHFTVPSQNRVVSRHLRV